MSETPDQLTLELKDAVDTFDRDTAAAICEKIAVHARSSEEIYPETEAKRALQCLRNKRYFQLMQNLADVFIQAGQDAPQIRRQYAQALIDQGQLTAAVTVLELLKHQAQNDPAEYAEACGLIGRAHKQQYVDAKGHLNTPVKRALGKAVHAYHGVYAQDRTKLWHGINAVACLCRAERDGVPIDEFPDARQTAELIAREVLAAVVAKDTARTADMWDLATAAEACLTLQQSEEALQWLTRYVRGEYSDAFELQSTLRQFIEVWQLQADEGSGALILPVLRAELMARKGGQAEVDLQDVSGDKLGTLGDAQLEARLGRQGFMNYKQMQDALARARAVARISNESDEAVGTGFLIRGKDLDPKLPDEWLLLTNAHVVTDDQAVHDASTHSMGPLFPDEAVVTFEVEAESGHDRKYKIERLLWTSPPAQCDASLLELQTQVDEVATYPIAKRLPPPEEETGVYIIGHPSGNSLSYSMQDNVLLDHEGPPKGKPEKEGVARLHYRAPTEGGSSGSPVFNRQWQLIGLHHAGGKRVNMLNGKSGIYGANEGIWIHSIMDALGQDFAN